LENSEKENIKPDSNNITEGVVPKGVTNYSNDYLKIKHEQIKAT